MYGPLETASVESGDVSVKVQVSAGDVAGMDVDLYDEVLLGAVRAASPVEEADLDLTLLGPPSPFRDDERQD